LSWHRDSLGELFQRFFFSALFFSCVLIFTGCLSVQKEVSDLPDIQYCLHKGLVPLLTILAFIIMKIVCLRD